MSIPQTQIIELRETNSKTIRNDTEPGNFKVVLDKPIQLEEGDEIGLHSAFIDTSANASGLIDLLPDSQGSDLSTISATVGYYVANIPSTSEGAFKGSNTVNSKTFNSGTLEENSDGKLYIACHKHTATPATAETIFGINFKKEASPIVPGKNVIEMDIFMTPMGSDTEKKLGSINIDLRDWVLKYIQDKTLFIDDEFYSKIDAEAKLKGQETPILKRVNFPFTSKIDKVRIEFSSDSQIASNIPQENPAGSGLFPDDKGFFNKEENAEGVQYLPVQKTISLSLPVGKYTASELCHRLGLEFTRADYGGSIPFTEGILTNNPLMPTIQQLRIEAQGQSEDQKIVFIESKDAENHFEFNTTVAGLPANYPIGTSQFGINFNEEDNKANFDMLHMDLLDVSRNGQSGLPEIREYAPNVAGNNKKFFANKHSGIYFIDLNPSSVWIDQLKFNPSIVAGSGKEVISDVGGENAKVYLYNDDEDLGAGDNTLKDGINITGSDMGLDTLISKTYALSADGANVESAFDVVLTVPTFPNYLASTTEDNIPIFGGSIINSAQYGSAEEGYYQVEIGMGIPTDIRGKDRFNNKIQGLVSKYYSQGSFTQSAGELGFQYIHKGSPITLSSFSVRILLPDNTPARDIEDNNTIFLKCIKQK